MFQAFSAKVQRGIFGCSMVAVAILLAGCSPRIAIEAPKEPITINLNVKIEHQILIKVDKEIDDLFNQQSDLF